MKKEPFYFEYICPTCLEVFSVKEKDDRYFCKKCSDELILIVTPEVSEDEENKGFKERKEI